MQQHNLWLKSAGKDGKRAHLRYADLKGADFQGANLQAADLKGADLQDADLRDADLRRAILQYTNLQGANLQAVDLKGANLQAADLRGADLQAADLKGANLRGTNLRGANLRGAEIDPSIRNCFSFAHAKFASDALPWLILHPKWSRFKRTIQVDGMTPDEVAAYSGNNTTPVSEAKIRTAIRRVMGK